MQKCTFNNIFLALFYFLSYFRGEHHAYIAADAVFCLLHTSDHPRGLHLLSDGSKLDNVLSVALRGPLHLHEVQVLLLSLYVHQQKEIHLTITKGQYSV